MRWSQCLFEVRLACLGSAFSFDILLERGAAVNHHVSSAAGSHPGHPIAFSVTFVLQIHLWHLGVSPTASRPRSDPVSDRGFHGDLTTIAMPLREQVFAIPGCSSAIAQGTVSRGLA